ncbi:unnamed protein product [Oikopleura dioica]|uniref:Uncharacterized protein n=1 Tax=Oikopleura dioica TaxID=34765 RepID=E4XPM5_OIKDI|nr:unnamed protein product [Oikopleura dioica]
MGFQSNLSAFGNETDCEDGVKWIFTVFNQCVRSPVEIWGFYLGLFSIICWFFVYLPQLYENYKRGRCDDALSIWFLLFWLLGDAANLTGCFLTHQFPIQTMTAIYYVIMDVAIIGQFFYYAFKNAQNPDFSSVAAASIVSGIYITQTENRPFRFDTSSQEAGYIIGLLSSVFYLGSRLPQIIMNFKRGKTDGVHPFTFLLAVIANFAYAFSVLMSKNDDGSSYEEFIMDHLPWLTGSLGTVALDFTILLQCLCLNKLNYDEIDDEEDAPLLSNS